FMYAVVALLVVSTLIQIVVTLNATRRAWTYRSDPARKSYPVVTAIAVVLSVSVLALGAYLIFDFRAARVWSLDHPLAAVSVSFLGMWIFMLCLMPLATLTGLLGVVGAALFIGMAPAISAFATEATGLLTNSQMATLPLFLMMGSFAAVSGMADDLY